ncbi:MAG: (d)CMP kinase [Candidatus Izemoplasmatales bacterium]|jgi:cytidylate kinase|nr:(d)CMP kinase [Candidatus Izemoplasmatales bacterium]MDD3864754.1 (d)CMP kinase [Candidatus Izemoplasmatales bacterium]
MNHNALAIDGPAAAGKSTVAKLLAKRLGYIYIDTGAMYRAATYKALIQNVDLNDPNAFSFLDNTKMEFHDGELYMDNENIASKIRSHQVSNNVSLVSSHIPVRIKLVAIQQKIAKNANVVMDGRDIGTVVLPHADLKIFMTASVEERARRRHEENLLSGIESEYTRILKDIEKRDKFDSTRLYNPLRQAEDALYLDTTNLDINEVTDNIYNLFIAIINAKRSE